jgi:hypothetical protein
VNELGLSIAGIRVRVASATAIPPTFVGAKLAPFVTQVEGSADVELTWRDADPRGLPLGETVFAPGSVWRMHRAAVGEPTRHAAVISYAEGGQLTEHAAVVESDDAWREVMLTERSRPAPWASMLNLGAGELIIRTRIIHESGLVFHSSAIDDGGVGVLMVGHAGAGKSTQASIWSAQPGVIALSDDRVGVRVADGVATAYGTPWGGTAGIARNHSVPLRAILVLEQAAANEATPLEPDEAVPALLARTFLPYWSARLTATAMETLVKILQAVPAYRFRCVPDESVVPVVRALL